MRSDAGSSHEMAGVGALRGGRAAPGRLGPASLHEAVVKDVPVRMYRVGCADAFWALAFAACFVTMAVGGAVARSTHDPAQFFGCLDNKTRSEAADDAVRGEDLAAAFGVLGAYVFMAPFAALALILALRRFPVAFMVSSLVVVPTAFAVWGAVMLTTAPVFAVFLFVTAAASVITAVYVAPAGRRTAAVLREASSVLNDAPSVPVAILLLSLFSMALGIASLQLTGFLTFAGRCEPGDGDDDGRREWVRATWARVLQPISNFTALWFFLLQGQVARYTVAAGAAVHFSYLGMPSLRPQQQGLRSLVWALRHALGSLCALALTPETAVAVASCSLCGPVRARRDIDQPLVRSVDAASGPEGGLVQPAAGPRNTPSAVSRLPTLASHPLARVLDCDTGNAEDESIHPFPPLAAAGTAASAPAHDRPPASRLHDAPRASACTCRVLARASSGRGLAGFLSRGCLRVGEFASPLAVVVAAVSGYGAGDAATAASVLAARQHLTGSRVRIATMMNVVLSCVALQLAAATGALCAATIFGVLTADVSEAQQPELYESLVRLVHVFWAVATVSCFLVLRPLLQTPSAVVAAALVCVAAEQDVREVGEGACAVHMHAPDPAAGDGGGQSSVDSLAGATEKGGRVRPRRLRAGQVIDPAMSSNARVPAMFVTRSK